MNLKFFEYAATYLKRTMDLRPIVKSVATLNSLINKQTRINEQGGKIFLLKLQVWWTFFSFVA